MWFLYIFFVLTVYRSSLLHCILFFFVIETMTKAGQCCCIVTDICLKEFETGHCSGLDTFVRSTNTKVVSTYILFFFTQVLGASVAAAWWPYYYGAMVPNSHLGAMLMRNSHLGAMSLRFVLLTIPFYGRPGLPPGYLSPCLRGCGPREF